MNYTAATEIYTYLHARALLYALPIWLDHAGEGLPDDEQLLGRLRDWRGLARPSLAVLLAYAKLAVQDAIEAAGFAEDALLQPTLLAAFPRQMTERFQPTILAHRLRAEIVATELEIGRASCRERVCQ